MFDRCSLDFSIGVQSIFNRVSIRHSIEVQYVFYGFYIDVQSVFGRLSFDFLSVAHRCSIDVQ